MTVLSIPKISRKITQSPTGSWWQSVFQSVDKSLIVEHGLIISFFFLLNLLHEQLFLDEGIVQLSVSVTELVVVNEKLKSFSKSWL